MGRTRLRGLELAGLRIAVEAPPSFCWRWPEPGLGSLACPPGDPDIYVGVSLGAPSLPDWEPVTYSFDGGTFDIGRVEDEWVIAVHGRQQRFERVARFDERFREGEVMISHGAVGGCAHPLEGPLLDLVVLHRLIALGGLVVAGSAVMRDGAGLAFLASEESGGATPGVRESSRAGGGAELFHTPGGRFALRLEDDGVVRVHGLPGASGQLRAGSSARLEAIHVVTPTSEVFAEPLSAERATSELLERVYAPVHDADCAAHLMEIVAKVTARLPFLKLGLPQVSRVVPFAWGDRQAARAFAVPPSI